MVNSFKPPVLKVSHEWNKIWLWIPGLFLSGIDCIREERFFVLTLHIQVLYTIIENTAIENNYVDLPGARAKYFRHFFFYCVRSTPLISPSIHCHTLIGKRLESITYDRWPCERISYRFSLSDKRAVPDKTDYEPSVFVCEKQKNQNQKIIWSSSLNCFFVFTIIRRYDGRYRPWSYLLVSAPVVVG